MFITWIIGLPPMAEMSPIESAYIASNKRRLFYGPFLLAVAVAVQPFSTCVAVEPKVDFGRQIRPLLSERCFHCHGPDEEYREGGLRLDQQSGAHGEADSGKRAIVPDSPESSELLRRLTTIDDDERMPPAESGKPPLSADEIALVRRWIEQGGTYEKHWALVPPRQAPLPQVRRRDWPRNEVDQFVMARWEKEGLEPSPEADRATLLRRLYLDLIGIPPEPKDVDAFVQDDAPQAYERQVDRLLASPRFGERWAQVWLDMARYADTQGYEKDMPRVIWAYRDWVIDAINRDMPFDQFTIEQLAGDLLPNASPQQILATAFHRNTLTNEEGGTDDEEFRVAAVKDRVDTTMQVWMGLTIGCAKCHTHKYDPISIAEYYRLYAFFNQTEDADRGDDAPTLTLLSKEQTDKVETLETDRKNIQAKHKEVENNREGDFKPFSEQLATIDTKIKELRSKASTPIMRELPEKKRRITRIHKRGNFLSQGNLVQPDTPTALGPLGTDMPKNRLGLARWLVHVDNPLTARVQVNRYWARLFGRGLVFTEEDFGSQGIAPTHPLLLDWLAVQFVKESWSPKTLIRRLVTSATYRQSSRCSAEQLQKDPTNQWLARGARFRLDAEIVRDQALAVAGLLSDTMYGAPVMPPQPKGIWQVTYSQLSWENATDENRYRRAIYTFWRRTSPYPSMLTFDAGSRELCVLRRVRTNTPLQALVTLNDPASLRRSGGRSSSSPVGRSGRRRRIAYCVRFWSCHVAGARCVRNETITGTTSPGSPALWWRT